MTSKYKIIFDNKKNIKKVLKGLPKKVKKQMEDAFESLEENPLPPNCLSCKRLEDVKCHSFKVGNYRIAYSVYKKEKEVKVLIIGDRKNIYKELKRKYK